MIKNKIIALILVSCCALISAQDALEYNYLYPSFPKDERKGLDPKPAIEGWANERVTEYLDRGAIALQKGNDMYLSWRLLEDDQADVSFNVYRSDNGEGFMKVNSQAISKTCDFVDKDIQLTPSITYQVEMLVDGERSNKSTVNILPEGYQSIKFQGNYQPEKIAIADLNGDGKYDFIIKQPHETLGGGSRGIQNASVDLTYKLEAYLSDGTFLWRKDLGLGIEPGIWYSPFIVYDFDGDGKAELALKTSGDDFVRNEIGQVLSGSEYFSVWNGMTGEEICKTPWLPRSDRLGNYNRTNRNQMGVAFLDGKTPFILIERGTYKAMFLEAYTYKKGKLTKHWRWDGDEANPIVRHQGSHFMQCADVDSDGRDEVILGSAVIDDTGDLLYSTGYGHPDRCFVTDIDPNREGLEIFYCIEDPHDDGNGVCLVDAKTGKLIWNIDHKTLHVGRGIVGDFMPEHPGLECLAGEDSKGGSSDKYMLSSNGQYLSRNMNIPSMYQCLFWDADLLREYVNTNKKERSFTLSKYTDSKFEMAFDGYPLAVADISGDWREEVMVSLPGELRIYSTSIEAKDKRVCLMQDPIYRNSVAHISMGYTQSPMTSYYLGEE